MTSSARSRRNEANNSAPGFNSDITYEQSSRVKSCCWQGKWFISLDQQSIQLWGRSHLEPDRIDVHQKQTFPDSRAHFISAVTHAAPLGPAIPIILAACLDHTLKVYSEKLRLRSSIKWDAGTVTMMVYNTKNDTIITTGSAGVHGSKLFRVPQRVNLWASTADTETFAKEKALAASDRPWFDGNGRIVPWCYGRFQTAKEQLAFQVPGLKTRITAADVAVPTAGNVSWCNVIELLVKQQLLLAMFQADVYGFDAADGSRLYSWRGLSTGGQPLVDMVYLTGHQQLVTASREPTVSVRQLQQDGSLAWVCSLGRFAAGVHCVAGAIGRPWLLTASLDGFVVAWSTETWQQLFRMKLPEAVTGMQFYKMDHFYCLSGNQVKFFKLRQAAECWMELNSPLMSLEPLSYGLLLATFGDSSIRLLDAGSSAADKSALTTVPQLSNASLLAAAADLPGGRLFALLNNGHVHVWDLHLTRPPALAVANKRNGIDVDKFDYLLRDSKMVGVTVPLDPQRIMMYSRLDRNKEQVVFKMTEYSNLAKGLFESRAEMHRRVYTHQKVKSVEFMVCDALTLAQEPLGIRDAVADGADIELYLHLDDSLLQRLQALKADQYECARDVHKAQELLKQLARRKFYKFVQEVTVGTGSTWLDRLPTAEEIIGYQSTSTTGVRLKAEDVIVCETRIDQGMKWQNPMDRVNFYQTRDAGARDRHFPITVQEVTNMFGTVFQDKKIRVYSKDITPEVCKALKYAFEEWAKNKLQAQIPGTPWRKPRPDAVPHVPSFPRLSSSHTNPSAAAAAADASNRGVPRFSDAAAAGDGLEPSRAANAANDRQGSLGSPDTNGTPAAAADAVSLAGFGSTVSQEMDQHQQGTQHMGSSGRSRKRSLISDMAASQQSQPHGSQQGGSQQQQQAADGPDQRPAKHSRLSNGSGGGDAAGGVSGRGRAGGGLPGIAEEAADGATE